VSLLPNVAGSLASKPPRLRIFAGPNGSGKSTLFPQLVQQRHFNPLAYINADEVQANLNAGLAIRFPIQDATLFQSLIKAGGFIRDGKLSPTVVSSLIGDPAVGLTLPKGTLCDGYLSAAICDAIRELLLLEQRSFGFETVMSHPSKVGLLTRAREAGFRVYLYFVSTGDSLVNVARVRQRVQEGGHDVPEDKILERYGRSLDLLSSAVRASDRAYIFDSTGPTLQLVASVTAGKHIEVHSGTVPEWVDRHLLSKAT